MQRYQTASSMDARKKFSRFKRERPKASRILQLSDEKVGQLLKLWEFPIWDDQISSDDEYAGVLRAVEGLNFSAREIEEFSKALGALQNEEDFGGKAGLLLSALINSGKDRDYTIHTRKLPYIHCIGYRNCKDLTVVGRAGDYACRQMQGGTVVIRGNAGEQLGHRMKAGTIIVERNSKNRVGWDMDGGSITVRRNARRSVGLWMKGGSITIEGDAHDDLGYGMTGGEIRVMGNLIFKKRDHDVGIGQEMGGGTIHLHGSYRYISPKMEAGRVYHRGRLLFDK